MHEATSTQNGGCLTSVFSAADPLPCSMVVAVHFDAIRTLRRRPGGHADAVGRRRTTPGGEVHLRRDGLRLHRVPPRHERRGVLAKCRPPARVPCPS